MSVHKSGEGDYFSKKEAADAVLSKRENADYPKNALIELSNACNHKCIFCSNPLQDRKISHIDFNIFSRFISESSSLGLKEVGLYATGEPFLTKDLDKYIRFIKQVDPNIRVYITTNGSLAVPERIIPCLEAGLDSIKFSINGSNRDMYLSVHGSDHFYRVLDNVKYVRKLISDQYNDVLMLASCIMVKGMGDYKDEFRAVFSHYFDDILFFPAKSQGGRYNRLNSLTSYDFHTLIPLKSCLARCYGTDTISLPRDYYLHVALIMNMT